MGTVSVGAVIKLGSARADSRLGLAGGVPVYLGDPSTALCRYIDTLGIIFSLRMTKTGEGREGVVAASKPGVEGKNAQCVRRSKQKRRRKEREEKRREEQEYEEWTCWGTERTRASNDQNTRQTMQDTTKTPSAEPDKRVTAEVLALASLPLSLNPTQFQFNLGRQLRLRLDKPPAHRPSRYAIARGPSTKKSCAKKNYPNAKVKDPPRHSSEPVTKFYSNIRSNRSIRQQVEIVSIRQQ